MLLPFPMPFCNGLRPKIRRKIFSSCRLQPPKYVGLNDKKTFIHEGSKRIGLPLALTPARHATTFGRHKTVPACVKTQIRPLTCLAIATRLHFYRVIDRHSHVHTLCLVRRNRRHPESADFLRVPAQCSI